MLDLERPIGGLHAGWQSPHRDVWPGVDLAGLTGDRTIKELDELEVQPQFPGNA
jgi:hypothetical protein